MKKAIALLILVLISLSLFSCGKKKSVAEKIIGQWEIPSEKAEATFKEGGVVISPDGEEQTYTITGEHNDIVTVIDKKGSEQFSSKAQFSGNDSLSMIMNGDTILFVRKK